MIEDEDSPDGLSVITLPRDKVNLAFKAGKESHLCPSSLAPAGQVNTDLALTLSKPAEFISEITDHAYADKMH